MERLPHLGVTDAAWDREETISYAFKEYELLVENTARVSEARQSFSSLYISVVNLGFLTGVGYLLLQFFQGGANSPWVLGGLFVIAVMLTTINTSWLKLSEQNRRLLNLRIRYLEELEARLAAAGVFPPVEIKLKADEIGADGKDTYVGRGTYTIEHSMYLPGAKRIPYGFTQAEETIGRLFTRVYWLAFLVAVACFAYVVLLPPLGIKLP